MNISLTTFQDDFAHALFAVTDEASGVRSITSQPGFAIYRNTVMKACIDALQANYPSVTRLVGEEWFRAAASLYVAKHAPQDPRMLYYGEQLPSFLAGLEPAASIVYLSDVARLDRMWSEAHASADEAALEPVMLAGYSAEHLGETVLYPHATARWAWFDDHPAYTIWKKNREPTGESSQIEWQGEGALLVRPHGKVLSHALDAAACAFLEVCKAGQPLGLAATAALSVQKNTDLGALLAMLLNAGAFGRMGRSNDEPL